MSYSRISIVLLIFFVLISSACNQVQKDSQKKKEKPLLQIALFDDDFIIGKWEAHSEEHESFDLWLNIDENKLYGQYCAINETATRIDCGEIQDDCYLKAEWPIEGNKIFLSVKSCYSGAIGVATLEIIDEGLLWKLTESSGKFGIDHFAPSEIKLIKVHFDPFE